MCFFLEYSCKQAKNKHKNRKKTLFCKLRRNEYHLRVILSFPPLPPTSPAKAKYGLTAHTKPGPLPPPLCACPGVSQLLGQARLASRAHSRGRGGGALWQLGWAPRPQHVVTVLEHSL